MANRNAPYGAFIFIINFDGGEIFVYTPGSPTMFLRHGGHEWSTAFDVMLTFQLPSENINALEAVSGVPEPSTVLLAICGLVCLFGARVRRRAL